MEHKELSLEKGTQEQDAIFEQTIKGKFARKVGGEKTHVSVLLKEDILTLSLQHLAWQ